MSKYFSHFPRDVHTGRVATDITKRVDFKKTVLADPYVYLPFLITDERAEDVALYYYGNVRFTWLVWFSARVRDPYYEWPMQYDNLLRYIQKKYSSLSGRQGTEVIAWTQNTTISENIVHYRHVSDSTMRITKESFDIGLARNTLNAIDWTPVRYFDYEFELNDDRRTINLLDSQYAGRAERELASLLNE